MIWVWWFACGCCSLVVRCLWVVGEWFVWCTGYRWALLLVVGVGVCFGVLTVALAGGDCVRFGWFLVCLLVGWLLWFLGFMVVLVAGVIVAMLVVRFGACMRVVCLLLIWLVL